MANTKGTKKLEEKRNSPEVQAFKKRIREFLKKTNPPDWMQYKILCDLSKKIDMPFYGEPKKRIGCDKTVVEIAKTYVDLLIEYGDNRFAEELMEWLSRQQSQTFRRIHARPPKQKERRSRSKNGVYEHPVPTNYSIKFLLRCIKGKRRNEACRYIDFLHQSVPQVFLNEKENKAVNEKFKDTMPKGWNWKTDSPFVRYRLTGIPESIYS